MATWSQASSAASENLHPCMASWELTLGVGGPGGLRRRCFSPHPPPRAGLLGRGPMRLSASLQGVAGRVGAMLPGAASRLPRDPSSSRYLRLSLQGFHIPPRIQAKLGKNHKQAAHVDKREGLTAPGEGKNQPGGAQQTPCTFSRNLCGVRALEQEDPAGPSEDGGPTLGFPSPRRQTALAVYPSLREELGAIF